jgi:methionyl-tRNA formyltransferase
MIRIGVIGNEQIALKSLKFIESYKDFETVFVFSDERRKNSNEGLALYCKMNNLNFYSVNNVNKFVDVIQNYEPDYILSISNYWILKKDLLEIPRYLTINFHNGPPNDYRGVNVPSWVIINGEKKHGVMWHVAKPEIDEGEVLTFKEFDVDSSETAASLMVKCINVGVLLFKDVVNGMLRNSFNLNKQKEKGRYYSKSDLPDKNGVIDFRKSIIEIDRLVRALNFIPFQNTLSFAKIRFGDKELIVNNIEIEHTNNLTEPGLIISINHSNFIVEVKDGRINILDTMDTLLNGYSGYEIANYFGIGIGQKLNIE